MNFLNGDPESVIFKLYRNDNQQNVTVLQFCTARKRELPSSIVPKTVAVARVYAPCILFATSRLQSNACRLCMCGLKSMVSTSLPPQPQHNVSTNLNK